MHSEKKGGRLETGPKLFNLFPVGYRTATPCFLTEIPIRSYFKKELHHGEEHQETSKL